MRSRNRQRQRALGAMAVIGSTVTPVVVVAAAEAAPTTPSRPAHAARLHASITDMAFLKRPSHSKTSRQISAFSLPQLACEAHVNNGWPIHTVSGATYTSKAFRTSLQAALASIAYSDKTVTVTTQTVHVKYDIGNVGAGGGHAGKLQFSVTGHRYDPTLQPTCPGSPQPASP